jgi:hypothetical protein
LRYLENDAGAPGFGAGWMESEQSSREIAPDGFELVKIMRKFARMRAACCP